MQLERNLDRDAATRRAVGTKPPIAGRAATLRQPRDHGRATPMMPLPLTDEERRYYDAAAFVCDPGGAECFRGLSRAESLEYIELQRAGLNNDDAAFLRLIRLGDRHASAMRLADDR